MGITSVGEEVAFLLSPVPSVSLPPPPPVVVVVVVVVVLLCSFVGVVAGVDEGVVTGLVIIGVGGGVENDAPPFPVGVVGVVGVIVALAAASCEFVVYKGLLAAVVVAELRRPMNYV